MKINRSSINFTTLVLLFAPWGDPPLGVLAVQNVRGKGSGGLFDRPGEDDPVQKIEAEDSTVDSKGNGNDNRKGNGTGNKKDEKDEKVDWPIEKNGQKNGKNPNVLDYDNFMNNQANPNFPSDDFPKFKDEGVHETLNSDNEIDYPLTNMDLENGFGYALADSLESGDGLLDGTVFNEIEDYEIVPYGTDDANYTSGESGDRSLRGTGTNRRLQTTCSGNKQVSLYKFCIDGNCDHGEHGEHKFRMDGNYLHRGVYRLREGQCHNLGGLTRTINAWKSLTVGTEEQDGGNWIDPHDSTYATMPSSKWYSPSCATYEILMNKKFKSSVSYTSCVDVGLSGSLGDVVEADISSSNCASWTKPAESFEWYLKVEAREIITWQKISNGRNSGKVIDLHQGWARPGQGVNLIDRRTHYLEPAQFWYMDVWGRIHSRSNPEYCLEGGYGTLYHHLYVQKCHGGGWQQWYKQSGRLRNKYHGKYIGVKHCASGKLGMWNLELQNYIGGSGDCANSQKWSFRNS